MDDLSALPGLECRQQPLRVRIAAGWFSILLNSELSGFLHIGKRSFFETEPIAGCVSLVGFRVDRWKSRDDLATLVYCFHPNLLS